jgi:glucose/arabinose dehydrogenase
MPRSPIILTTLLGLVLATNLPAQTVTDADLAVDVVTQGLSAPTTMAFLGPDDILVLEKNNGRVRRVINGVLQTGAVLDVPVNFASERGLLGIAINDQVPPRVFLYYTENPASAGDDNTTTPLGNRIYRYTWNGSTLDSPRLVLNLPVQTGPNHDGGVLVLGPPEGGLAGDGRPLYAVIGDLNRNGQLENFPNGAAPDDTGVIVRIQQDDNGSPHPLNPFFPYCSVSTATTCTSNANCPAGETCLTRVARYYAYGVRNSFGLTIDPASDVLWDTENGPDTMDEVNRVAPGFNSGWQQIMGPNSRDPQGLGDLFNMPGGQSVYSDPEFSWLDTTAPTAIVFPVGSALGPDYDQAALVGDSNLGNLYKFPLNAARDGFVLGGDLADLVADSQTEANQLRIGSGFGRITDLKIGPDGNLYVVSIGGGAIYRIRPASPTPTPTATGVPTATVTAAPTPTPTVAPTPTPKHPPTPTPLPTAPPLPTVTPTPTVTPVATPTFVTSPTPTATPAATVTPTPTPPCTNDDLACATDTGGVDFTTTQSTASATTATSDPSTCPSGAKNSRSVWFRFTAAGKVDVRAETTGSSYDTVLALWQGAPGALSLIKCNDNDGGGTTSKVDFATQAGTTYFLEVMARGQTSGGSLKLQVRPMCGGRIATIVGTEGSDVLDGGGDDDVIAGLAGDDTIRGFAGKDRLCGNDGADKILGGDGNDKILGGTGNDTLQGEAGSDTLNGGSGTDVCQGGAGSNSLSSCP